MRKGVTRQILTIEEMHNALASNSYTEANQKRYLRRQTMDTNSSKGDDTRKTVYYAGSGLAIGAAIGMIFGLMLLGNLALGSAIGAGVGLVIGAAIDAQGGLLK